MSHDVDTRPDRTDADDPAAEFDHVTIDCDSAPDECAIFPREATEEELLTTWVTAQGDSFVDLESMR